MRSLMNHDIQYLAGLTADIKRDQQALLSVLPYGTKFKIMGRYDDRLQAEDWVSEMLAKGAEPSPMMDEPQDGEEFWVYLVKTQPQATNPDISKDPKL